MASGANCAFHHRRVPLDIVEAGDGATCKQYNYRAGLV